VRASSRGAGHLDHAEATPDVVFARARGFIVGAKLYYVALTRDLSAVFSRGGSSSGAASWEACWRAGSRSAGKKLSLRALLRRARHRDRRRLRGGAHRVLAVGDDYGRPWSGPLAVTFPDGAPPVHGGEPDAHVRRAPPAGDAAPGPSIAGSTPRSSTRTAMGW
jgi:hypothetical protein